jgi:hypothetical protein
MLPKRRCRETQNRPRQSRRARRRAEANIRDYGITKDVAPFGKAAIRSEDHGAFFVAGVNELEDQIAATRSYRQIADLVDDQEGEAAEEPDLLAQAALAANDRTVPKCRRRPGHGQGQPNASMECRSDLLLNRAPPRGLMPPLPGHSFKSNRHPIPIIVIRIAPIWRPRGRLLGVDALGVIRGLGSRRGVVFVQVLLVAMHWLEPVLALPGIHHLAIAGLDQACPGIGPQALVQWHHVAGRGGTGWSPAIEARHFISALPKGRELRLRLTI